MEIVQKRMELMTEEFEEMGRTKLFDREESRKIMKKRKEYEYQINGVSKNLQVFKEYIEYEKAVLENIRQRRNKFRIGEKKGSLEHRIINRIKSLYETALVRFSDDMTMCLSYFKFCRQANYVSASSVALQNMLKNHSHKPEAWHITAQWHAYDRKDLVTGIKILRKGITLHKSSKILYSEVIKFELNSVVDKEGVNKSEECVIAEPTEKERLCTEKLQMYIKEIVNNISDCSYYIELLEMLQAHVFTLPAQNSIIEHLCKAHKFEPIMWHTLAQRERKGLHFGESDENFKSTTKTRLARCFAKYREGIENVPPANKEHMWSLYLDCLIEQRQDDFGVANVFKTNSLKLAFEQASSEGYIPEKYYLMWLELGGDEEALTILEKGTTAYPQSVELWKLRLRYQIIKDDPESIERMFQAGIECLKEKSLPLWSAILRYHLLTSSDSIIQSFYKEAVKQPREISDVLKSRYIEWLVLARGIKEARSEYFTLAKEKPHSKDLHLAMSKLEATELEYNLEAWEQVHKLACEQFGKEDVDVWINYIQFHLMYKTVGSRAETVKKIFDEAKSSLPEFLFLDFNDRYYNLTQSL